jgi:hypothetical protein
MHKVTIWWAPMREIPLTTPCRNGTLGCARPRSAACTETYSNPISDAQVGWLGSSSPTQGAMHGERRARRPGRGKESVFQIRGETRLIRESMGEAGDGVVVMRDISSGR